MIPVLLNQNAGGNADWSITAFLENLSDQLVEWGGLIMLLLGVVMVIVAVYQIASGLMSHGKKQTNWFVAAGLLLLGGALVAGGGAGTWTWVTDIAAGGKNTIDDLGSQGNGGTIINMLPFIFK